MSLVRLLKYRVNWVSQNLPAGEKGRTNNTAENVCIVSYAMPVDTFEYALVLYLQQIPFHWCIYQVLLNWTLINARDTALGFRFQNVGVKLIIGHLSIRAFWYWEVSSENIPLFMCMCLTCNNRFQRVASVVRRERVNVQCPSGSSQAFCCRLLQVYTKMSGWIYVHNALFCVRKHAVIVFLPWWFR